jgi:SAM-dependent methyltransferase
MLHSRPPPMDLKEVPSAPFARHPWEIARARFFLRVLRDAGVLTTSRACLDVGAGDGYLARSVMEALPPSSHMTCLDIQYTDADLRRFAEPTLPGLSFVRERPAARFDVLLLLDVIEHVPDDVEFLRGLVTDNLAPGGRVVISVPAWQGLFSRYDEALDHRRRYSPRALERTIQAAGLAQVKRGGLFHSLLFPRLLSVARERVSRKAGRSDGAPPNLGQWSGGAAISKTVDAALAVDNAVSRVTARLGVALPGLSCWALCEREAADAATS